MSPKKRLDCVEMKNEIQAQLLKEHEGMSDAQVREHIERNLEANKGPVGKLWRKLQSQKVS